MDIVLASMDVMDDDFALSQVVDMIEETEGFENRSRDIQRTLNLTQRDQIHVDSNFDLEFNFDDLFFDDSVNTEKSEENSPDINCEKTRRFGFPVDDSKSSL